MCTAEPGMGDSSGRGVRGGRIPTQHPNALVSVAMATPPGVSRLRTVSGGEFESGSGHAVPIPTQTTMTSRETVGEPPPLLRMPADAEVFLEA